MHFPHAGNYCAFELMNDGDVARLDFRTENIFDISACPLVVILTETFCPLRNLSNYPADSSSKRCFDAAVEICEYLFPKEDVVIGMKLYRAL